MQEAENHAENEENEEKKPFQRIPRAIKKLQKYQNVKIKGAQQRKKLTLLKNQRWNALTKEQKESIRERRKQGDLKQKAAFENGLEVYVDMDYDVYLVSQRKILMEDREIRSLALQVAHIVGANRELPTPIKLHLTNYSGVQRVEMEKQGSASWLAHKHEQSIQELVRNSDTKKEFIYLSPDAEEEVTDTDPEKYIFIVGGFVDRTVQKFMSLNKASALQICSMRLPIDKFMKKRKRPLNIDTVVSLLSEFHASKNWEDAYNKATARNEGIVTEVYKSNGNV